MPNRRKQVFYPSQTSWPPIGLVRGEGATSLAQLLFGSGEDGFLAYPALAANLYQDSAGTTPVASDSDPVGRFTDQSGKGRNATQATAGARPLWRSNSGKPYLQFDGADDVLATTFAVTSAATLACAFNAATLSRIIAGGGDGTVSQRCFIGFDGSGRFGGGWGAQNQGVIFGGSDIRNQNHVGILNADASTVELWLDGTMIYSGAASGSLAGNALGVVLGANRGSSIASFMACNMPAALCRSVKSTAAEIARINADFQRTF